LEVDQPNGTGEPVLLGSSFGVRSFSGPITKRRNGTPIIYIQNWAWYELLGIVAPLVLFWWFGRIAAGASGAWLNA